MRTVRVVFPFGAETVTANTVCTAGKGSEPKGDKLRPSKIFSATVKLGFKMTQA